MSDRDSDVDTLTKKKKRSTQEAAGPSPKKNKKRTEVEEEDPEDRHSEKYNVILSKDKKTSGTISDFSVYLGAGYAINVKEFRRSHYINLTRETGGEIRNRFNIPLNLLDNFKKGVEHIAKHIEG